MSKDVKFWCDMCGREIWSGGRCLSLKVLATQVMLDSDYDDSNISLKKRSDYYFHVCENCSGVPLTINSGDDHRFNVSIDGVKNLLKNFGFAIETKEESNYIIHNGEKYFRIQ